MNESQISQFLAEWNDCAAELTIAFEAKAPEGATRPISTLQMRYLHACMALAKFLKSIGRDSDADRFHELAEAFFDVSEGLKNPLFKVETPSSKAGRKNDSSALWRIRANVVVALEMLIAGDMTESEAVTLAKKKHRAALSRLFRTRAGFESSLKNWCKSFAEGKVSNEMAKSAYDTGMDGIAAAKLAFSREKIIALGESLLQKSAQRAALLPI